MKKIFKRIYVEITNNCNLNCRFCDLTNRKLEYMSLENIKRIFKKISYYTDYISLHVKGEPLMHNNLKEILEIAEKNNLKVVITTNGTLLEKWKDIFKESKALNQINISLHSIEQNEILNNIDKRKYLFNLLNNINEIVEKNDNMYISYRLWNLEDFKKSIKNSEIIHILSEYYNIKDLDLELADKSFFKIKDRIYINMDLMYEWPSLSKDFLTAKGTCYGLINQIAILVDGTVVPCCLDQNGDINLGNILKSNLKEILDSDISKEILNGFKNKKLVHPLCQRCDFRKKHLKNE